MYLQTPRAGPPPNQMAQRITCMTADSRKIALENWMANPQSYSYLGFATQMSDKLSAYAAGDVLLSIGVGNTVEQQPEAYVDVGCVTFPKSLTEAAINLNFFKKVSIVGVNLNHVQVNNGKTYLDNPVAAISGMVTVNHTGDEPMATGRWVMMRLPRAGIGRELGWKPPALKAPNEKGPNPRNGLELYPLNPYRVKPQDLAPIVQFENLLAASQTRTALEDFLDPIIQAVTLAMAEAARLHPRLPEDEPRVNPNEEEDPNAAAAREIKAHHTYVTRLRNTVEYNDGINKWLTLALKSPEIKTHRKDPKTIVNGLMRMTDQSFRGSKEDTVGTVMASKLLPISATLMHQVSGMRLGTVVTPANPGKPFTCMLSDRASSLYQQLSLG